jgi:WD40 repeat protein/tetratricopeptide (TPR) repeat protein
LVGKVSNPQAVLEEILAWTGGQPFLTQKLCKIVLQSGDRTDDPKSLIDRLTQTHVIDTWETQDEPEHLRTIRDRLLYNGNSTSKLLGLYQQILQKGEIPADNSYEQMQLQLSGLVVKQQGSLRVYNRIYESVFDSRWVEKALADLRPYSEAITAWLESSCEDESRLLQGKALQDAQAWAVDKKLSDADYQFINASLDLERREAQTALTSERIASQVLVKINQRASKASQKSTRTIKIKFAGLILLSVGAIAIAGWATLALRQSQNELKETQAAAKLEREGKNVEQQFKVSQLDTLVSTMKAAQEFKTIVSDGRPVEEYPTTTPMLSLQTTLDRIHEKNRIQDRYEVFKNVEFSEGVQNVEFSPDGKLLATLGKSTILQGGEIKLWTFEGRQLAKFYIGRCFNELELRSTKFKFSPDGNLLATTNCGTNLGKVFIFNRQGQIVAEITNDRPANFSFSPDSKLLATINIGKVQLWNLQGQQVATFSTDHPYGREISFSPDGKLLFIPGKNRVQLWNLQGKRVVDFPISNKTVGIISEIGFSPDKKYLVINIPGDGVRLWNSQGKSSSKFYDISFSPDGKWIATVGFDARTRLFNVQKDYKMAYELPIAATQVEFSHDSKLWATFENPFRNNDPRLRLWNLQGQQVGEFSPHTYTDSFQFSDNGKQLATVEPSYRDSTGEILTKVRLWNVQEQQVNTFPSKHDYSLSPDGKLLATVGDDDKVRLWDLQGRQVAIFPTGIPQDGSLNFSPDGKLVVFVEYSEKKLKVRLFNLQGQQVATFPTNGKIKFSPNGKLLATVGDDNKVWLWDDQGQQIATFPTGDVEDEDFHFSPDGKLLAIIEGSINDKKVRLWNLQGEEVVTFPIKNVQDVSFSPDGKLIAILDSAENNFSWSSEESRLTIRLWNLQGHQVAVSPGDYSRPAIHKFMSGTYNKSVKDNIKFSPDGKQVVIAGVGNSYSYPLLWNIQEDILTNLPPSQYVRFSPDSKLLASVGYDNQVILWNSQWELVAKFPNGNVADVWFSPDSKLLAIDTGSKVELWNRKGQQVAEFSGNSRNSRFSSDGKLLALAKDSNKVKLWRVRDLDELLNEGCDYLKDYFATHPEAIKELHVCQTKLGILPPKEFSDTSRSIKLPEVSVITSIQKWLEIPRLIRTLIFTTIFLLIIWRADIICLPGFILRLFKKDKQAIIFYDKVVQIVPKWYRVWLIRGDELCSQQHYDRAIDSYNRAYQINSKKYEDWFSRVEKLNELNRHEEALNLCDKAIEIRPNESIIWSNRGWQLQQLKRYEEAIDSYEEAIKLNPKAYQNWYKHGQALSELGRREEAIASCDKAIEIVPNDYWSWNKRGLELSQLQRYEEALASYDQAIQINSEEYETWLNRGRALGQLNRHEEAIISYDKALELTPKFYDTLCSLYEKGLALTYLERYKEAIRVFEQIVQIRSDNLTDLEQALIFVFDRKQHLMTYLGAAYALQGNIDEAQRRWKEGLDLCQADDTFLKLSRVLYKIALGETEEGITEMQAVLEEDISVGRIQEALEDAEMLERCSIEGSDRVVQLLKQRLKVVTSQS